MDGLLCHCRVNPDGHEPGSVLDCEAVPVKAGEYVRAAVGGTSLDTLGRLRYGSLGARGTCPSCGKGGVRVVRIETRAHLYPAKPGALLNVAPGMAPHKVKGQPCPGAGKPPTETRYTPGRELASWVRVHGSEAVA